MQRSVPPAFICERSIPKTAVRLALLLLIGVCCLVASRLFIFDLETVLKIAVGWGIVMIVITRRLFHGGPNVVIDEHGINDLRTSWGLFRWNEIVALSKFTFNNSPCLCIELVNEQARIATLSWWARFIIRLNRHYGLPAVFVDFTCLTPGLAEACRYLEAHHPEKFFATTST